MAKTSLNSLLPPASAERRDAYGGDPEESWLRLHRVSHTVAARAAETWLARVSGTGRYAGGDGGAIRLAASMAAPSAAGAVIDYATRHRFANR